MVAEKVEIEPRMTPRDRQIASFQQEKPYVPPKKEEEEFITYEEYLERTNIESEIDLESPVDEVIKGITL